MQMLHRPHANVALASPANIFHFFLFFFDANICIIQKKPNLCNEDKRQELAATAQIRQNIMKTLSYNNEAHFFEVIATGEKFALIPFDCKVDVATKQFCSIGDAEYRRCQYPTINELVANGVIAKGQVYREYTVVVGVYACANRRDTTVLEEFNAEKIVEIFRDKGFVVEVEGIQHNYEAWRDDYKSGYRGEHCHIFSPCGCNALRFEVSELHPACADWQTTYIA
jgi:hypothetical protein